MGVKWFYLCFSVERCFRVFKFLTGGVWDIYIFRLLTWRCLRFFIQSGVRGGEGEPIEALHRRGGVH